MGFKNLNIGWCIMPALCMLIGCERPPMDITITVYLGQSIVRTNNEDYYICDISSRAARGACTREYMDKNQYATVASLFDSSGCSITKILKDGKQAMMFVNTRPKVEAEHHPPLSYYILLTPADSNKQAVICEPDHITRFGF